MESPAVVPPRQLPSGRRFFERARFDFLFGTFCAFGPAVVVYLYDKVPPWAIGVATFLWFAVLFVIVLLHVAWQEEHADHSAKTAETESLRAYIRRDELSEQVNLTMRVITSTTTCLRSMTEELREASADPRGTQVPDALKARLLPHLMKNLRLTFEGDTRNVDKTTWPHNFFKIALFEPKPAPNNAYALVRTFYDYPEGLEPSSETSTFNIESHARSAVVLAFSKQDIVVIEDIKTENGKPADVKRWINRRENQSEEYESMVCAAIVSGRRGNADRKCLGVLVIDTNRERYFKEEQSYRAFLGAILNPFRTALTLALEMESYVHPRPEERRSL